MPILISKVLISLLAVSPFQASQDIEIINDQVSYGFAEAMRFQLEAASDASIEEIVLRFQVEGEDVRNRRIPSFTPGLEVTAEHEETLHRGALHPTAVVTWWWTIKDAAGNETVTERQEVRYMDQALAWESIEDDGLRVWYHDGDVERATEMLSMADRGIDALEEMLGSRPEQLIEIVTYQDQGDLRRALADRGATYEQRLATLGARVAENTIVVDVGARGERLEDVVRHELSHVVLNLEIGPSWVNAPAWFDEGMAMYAEGDLGRDEGRLLERAIAADTLLSARSLTAFPGEADLVGLAYVQSRDLVAFLIEEHDPELLRELVSSFAEGKRTFEVALQEVYGYDHLSLYQQYRSSRGLPEAIAPPAGATIRNTARQEPDVRSRLREGCPAALALFVVAMALTAVTGRPRHASASSKA